MAVIQSLRISSIFKREELLVLLFLLLLSSVAIAQDPVYQLVWADEFEGQGAIDSNKWHHQTLLPNGNSWYNGEIQHYTNREINSYQSDGTLKIVAKKEIFTDQGVTKDYTSARLNSKFAFTYGKVEIRAKLPTGIGTWPALWTLGQNITEPGGYWEEDFGTTPWPACGELDIMEHWGINQDYVQSAIHTPSSHGNTVNKGGQVVSGASEEFHVYTMEWTEELVRFWVDDVLHYTYQPSVQNADTWPFDANQYLLFNVAILPDIHPDFTESEMEVDYVRVYQESVLGTQQSKSKQIKIAPNPADKNVAISSKVILESIRIFDNLGRLQLAIEPGSTDFQIDTDMLAPGLYFVQFSIDGRNGTQKLVIN